MVCSVLLWLNIADFACPFMFQDGVCSYSVNATSIDGEPLFTDKKFPSLAGEDNTVNISLPLPTSEECYITVSACNALGCGPPSSPLTISKDYNLREW